ncbi:MAG TPA: hypothetical protein VF406_05440 [Thermodesulfobacteriota bacterium]
MTCPAMGCSGTLPRLRTSSGCVVYWFLCERCVGVAHRVVKLGAYHLMLARKARRVRA